MERQLQERMIGATVLMIVAVLVVPELLSGPKPMASPPAAVAHNDSARRDPSGMGVPVAVPATVVAGAVPSSSGAAPTAASRPPIEQAVPPVAPAVAPPAPVPVIAAPVKSPHALPVQTPPAATGASAERTSAGPLVAGHAPLKPSSDKPISEKGKGKWLVQVGSYAQASTAKRIAKDLQNHGFAASVLPIDLQGKRLYRVRVGPATDRKTADETLRRVQHLMPSSRLVGNQ